MFFATQQDFLFLALCAYSRSEQLPAAIEDVKENFLTTWIMDCSLWPLVNFVGFAFVPNSLQPSYMAFVQFFWQIYISTVGESEPSSQEDHELLKLFQDIDADHVIFFHIRHFILNK